jgi:hypothetical protein
MPAPTQRFLLYRIARGGGGAGTRCPCLTCPYRYRDFLVVDAAFIFAAQAVGRTSMLA